MRMRLSTYCCFLSVFIVVAVTTATDNNAGKSRISYIIVGSKSSTKTCVPSSSPLSMLSIAQKQPCYTAFCNIPLQEQRTGFISSSTIVTTATKSKIRRTKLSLLPYTKTNNDGTIAGSMKNQYKWQQRPCRRQHQQRSPFLSSILLAAAAAGEERRLYNTFLAVTKMSTNDNIDIEESTATTLQESQHDDDSDFSNELPPYSDTAELNIALSELAKSGQTGSAQKAQDILDTAESWYEQNRQSINSNDTEEEETNNSNNDDFYAGPVPDIRSYTYVIDAWSREGGKNAASNAQCLLDSLIEISNKESSGDRSSSKNKKNKNKHQTRRMKPNTVTYNLVIHTWAKSGQNDAAKHAEELLNQMIKHSSDGTNPHCTPDSTTYNAVMNAWSKSALSLDRNSDNDNNNKGGSNRENQILNDCAGENAERLLDEMWHQYDITSNPNLRPTQFSYATAISAWARTAAQLNGNASRKCAQRAEALLEQMEELAQSHEGWGDLHPTTYCVNAVLNAWAKSRTKGSAQRAQEILERMERLYDYGLGREEVRPNAVSFNTVIDAWAKSGEHGSERQAESILRRMDELSSHPDTKEFYGDCRPDTISYNTVVHAWGRSREPAAARRAEAILRHMERRYEEDINSDIISSKAVTPDVTTYTSVLNAWARSRETNAASRAESILKRMKEASSSSNTTEDDRSTNFAARPTVLSYNTVLNAWAKSSHPEAADRALALLKQIEDGRANVQPDVFTYTSVIDALAKRATEESAKKTEEILERMEALHDETGDDSVRPNIRTYTSVIHALSRGKCNPQRAEAILDRIERLSVDNSSIRPDVVSFNAVINAWGWSDAAHKAKRAREIYLRMKELYESGENSDARPDLITCNSILNACAFTKGKRAESKEEGDHENADDNDGAQERAEALDIAVRTLEEFQSTSPKFGRPNHITYGTMLMAITNLMTPAQSSDLENMSLEDVKGDTSCLRTDLAISTFWQCCRDGQVSPFVVAQLRNVVPEATFCEMLGDAAVPCVSEEYDDVSGNMTSKKKTEKEHRYCCDMKKLPVEWTTFSTGKKSRPSRKRYSDQVSKQ